MPHYISALLCVLLFTLGHVIRDGWPATGHTQLARLFGAAACGIGAYLYAGPLIGLAAGGGVLLSFYADQDHAEGQNAKGWRDAAYLMVSGLTSVAPIVVTMVYFIHFKAVFIMFVGFFKPVIWFTAWRIAPASVAPTRLAAAVFGAAIGASLVVLIHGGIL